MAARDAAERRLIARMGGYATAARGANAGPAYAARWGRYLARADELHAAQAAGNPDWRPLDDAERHRRAKALERLDMARLSRRAAEARARKRQAREAVARQAALAVLGRDPEGGQP
jgi:phytoene dehydrogenase-like protein